MEETTEQATQRVDKWLWYARFFKTRSLAAKFISSGHIRLSREATNNAPTTRIDKPRTAIRPGDVLTFMLGDRVKIIEVLDCGTRRGPAVEARTLYEDRSPPPPPKEDKVKNNTAAREPGSGRPTKKDRRATDALKQDLF